MASQRRGAAAAPPGWGHSMTAQANQAAATSRLRHALLTYQGGQALLLEAHRQMKDLTAGEVETFWAGPGVRLEQYVQARAVEVVDAFRIFSAVGLVASAEDRHRVTEADASV